MHNISAEQDKYEYLKDIHQGQNEMFISAISEKFESKSVPANTPFQVSLTELSPEISMKLNIRRAVSDAQNPKGLKRVSKAVVSGLNSILNSIESVHLSQSGAFNKKNKSVKKRRMIKKKIGCKSRASPRKTSHQINIPTHRLKNIVNSLSLL